MLHLFCVTLNTTSFQGLCIAICKMGRLKMSSWSQTSLLRPLSGRHQTKSQLLLRPPPLKAARIPGHCILTSHAEVNLAGIWIIPEVRSEFKDQNRRGLRDLGKD